MAPGLQETKGERVSLVVLFISASFEPVYIVSLLTTKERGRG